ncbi:MAG: DUF2283 domain-containing protein [Desulfobacterales bacterium]|nr:DUF2283 domain-containing protein [Desulfobacterales bacterium]
MKKSKMTYFQESDVIHLTVSEDAEAGSVEISPNITVELNNVNELIGIEILNASSFIHNLVLESVQAKMFNIVVPSAGKRVIVKKRDRLTRSQKKQHNQTVAVDGAYT